MDEKELHVNANATEETEEAVEKENATEVNKKTEMENSTEENEKKEMKNETEETKSTTDEKDNASKDTTTKEDAEEIKDSDLLELIAAIKFAYPDYGIRRVHREITQVAAITGSEPLLKNVKLGEVKRLWKTLPDEEVPKFYTVGEGSVSSLVNAYGKKAREVAESQEDHFVHLFLDVPADRSGKSPYQALINFSEEKCFKSEGQEFVKIQIAACADDTKNPMLLYNSNRSARTFIHPDKMEEDTAYDKIHSLISHRGIGGVLGSTGGKKAYFRCQIQKDKGVVSVDVSDIAQEQPW